MAVTVVGDPRQHTYSTNNNPKSRAFRGPGFSNWLAARSDVCELQTLDVSHRCWQDISDFADGIFPDLPKTTSANLEVTGHEGISVIKLDEVEAYVERWEPTVLRYSVRQGVPGLRAVNIGVMKGGTCDRVLIFGSAPMLAYVKTLEHKRCKTLDLLYVAVTRARFSATFVDG